MSLCERQFAAKRTCCLTQSQALLWDESIAAGMGRLHGTDVAHGDPHPIVCRDGSTEGAVYCSNYPPFIDEQLTLRYAQSHAQGHTDSSVRCSI